MKKESYAREIIIGALLLIITSLILILYTKDLINMPPWFFENMFLGAFTLMGAFLGAFLAGKSTLKIASINHEKEQVKINEIYEKNKTFLVQTSESLVNELEDLYSEFGKFFNEQEYDSDQIDFINFRSESIKVLIEEILLIDINNLHWKHSYYHSIIRKDCKLLITNYFISGNLDMNFKPTFQGTNNMVYMNNLSICKSNINGMTNKIKTIKLNN